MGAAESIQHVVVLMLENRSFDHMLGWPAVEGLTVPVDPGDPGVGRAPVFALTTPDAYRTDPDPGHDFEDVTLQLFGRPDPTPGGTPTNDGFVLSYAQRRDARGHVVGPEVGRQILGCFQPEMLPVLRTLAAEFVVCDRWFASVPGSTWPNRDFVHAGTSMGHVNSPTFGEQFWGYRGVRTIYQNLGDAGRTWKIYYHDVPQAFWFRDLLPYKDTNFADFALFDADAQGGALPQYSFIEPRYLNSSLQGANDQHPPHDVALGERLMAAVYDSLRRDEEVWQQSLLIILYDEHGGFYDHVSPPATVNPDGQVSTSPPFAFDRLGVRVPALLVSPWVGRGRVDSTIYDHTSILGFLKKHFGLPGFMHERDAAANTFERNFLDTPRDDAPQRLSAQVPSAARGRGLAASRAAVRALAQRPPTETQRRLLALAASLTMPETQHAAAKYVAEQMAALKRARPARRQQARRRASRPTRRRRSRKTR